MLKSLRLVFILIALSLGTALAVQAQTSLGLGAADPVGTASSQSSGILAQINLYQQEFYRALTSALKGMREDPAKLWLLIGLSFAYGIFHAAGPGHGKAVISSYMIANEVELRRGVLLSFLAAFMQGFMALIVVGSVYFALKGTNISMNNATHALELASYVLIIAFGAWLLWRKLKSHFKPKTHDHHDSHKHHHEKHDHHHEGHHHHHEEGVCSDCGHSHMPEPKSIDGDFSLKQAWSAVIAVGIRPCSGSIFVLSFALLNGLYLGGILSVFAVSIGTAITVSILATLAVSAKNIALKFSNSTHSNHQISSVIEIFGALLVLSMGIILLTAALS
ncbi:MULTISPECIES: nickel/cobalt transporter [unclassified Lentilitoribacter]|jgi:ABC-type nickel/cobalt efflux system permease component RcnA|uniref:nickel/cobalt transporter n=1 Tax=unclassified Lentilitoribacter TaxID=2647570 RepID=UPI0013A69D11|nr:nickel/cobalt transporter [Lentilitoribacter sp. Alg239-R112]